MLGSLPNWRHSRHWGYDPTGGLGMLLMILVVMFLLGRICEVGSVKRRSGHQRTVPYLGDHIRQNVFGAVAPASGELFSLIGDGVDTDVFQFFLDEMAQAVPGKLGVRKMLILDNASWHESAPLNWHQFEPKFPSGYSPAFNPVRRLWLRLKVDWFWDYSARSPSGPLAPPLPGPQKLRQQPRQNRV